MNRLLYFQTLCQVSEDFCQSCKFWYDPLITWPNMPCIINIHKVDSWVSYERKLLNKNLRRYLSKIPRKLFIPRKLVDGHENYTKYETSANCTDLMHFIRLYTLKWHSVWVYCKMGCGPNRRPKMHTSPLNTDLSEYICHTCVLNASLVNSTFNLWNAFMTTFQKCFWMQK